MAWSCALCTFENAENASRCAICEHPAACAAEASPSKPPPASAVPPASGRAPKKPKTAAGAKSKVQAMLAGVGSSREAEARRLQRKVQQMRELGIELPTSEILPLLARHCYSVPVAANAYFERLALDEAHASAAPDTETATRIERLVAHFERGFARDRPGLRLLGSVSMAATVTRSGAKLRAGQELVLQAENVGKKRLRPGGAAAASRGASPSTPSATPPPPTLVTTNGFVRILDASKSQIGRLERELEVALHPLMKEKLVALGSMCRSPPLSTQMFAAFEVTAFVYVSESAFAIFDEEHPQFYLADALYSLLEMVKPKTEHPDAAADPVTDSVASDDASADLDTLFSECVGASDMLEATDADGQERGADPSAQLAPLLVDIELRAHQKQALRWMLWREQLEQAPAAGTAAGDADAIDPMWEERRFHGDAGGCYYVNPFEKSASLRRPAPPKPCLGGILADDMGMGKTMMMLSLIAHRKHFDAPDGTQEATEQPRPAFDRPRGKGSHRKPNATLIVCPLSLLHQWQREVEERFRPRALSVLVFYGDERESAPAAALASADVVLTTYGVLSAQHERLGADGPLTHAAWRRVILDEAHSIKNRATGYFRACAALQARHRWCLTGTPIQNSLDDVFSLLSFLRYEPWARAAWWKRVVARPFESGEASAALARLKAILSPVLLRRTKLSRDARGQLLLRLPAKREQLVSLVFSPDERAFYRAVYDKSRAEFNGFVASGATMSSYVAIFALLLRLRQACDHPLLALGRDAEQVPARGDQPAVGAAQSAPASASASASGPALGSFRFRPRPDEGDDAYYRRISAQLRRDDATGETASGGDSGDCSSADAGPTPAYVARVMAQVEGGLEAHECPVCLDAPTDGVLTPCAHVLCAACLRDSLAADPDAGCPVCRSPVDPAKVFVLPASALGEASDAGVVTDAGAVAGASAASDADASGTGDDVFLSAKLRQLVLDVETVRAEDRATGDKRKVVVFSQWTRMLDMAARALGARGFRCAVFHGGLSRETRERVLAAFARDAAADVLAVSLRAGGVGLNLTCASVVVLLDPWWNPGVEQQAVDRVHRLGQTRDVLVRRYAVADTVEDVLLALQARKQALAARALVAAQDGARGGGDRALSLDDLKRFFR